jgi:hypothetical protein
VATRPRGASARRELERQTVDDLARERLEPVARRGEVRGDLTHRRTVVAFEARPRAQTSIFSVNVRESSSTAGEPSTRTCDPRRGGRAGEGSIDQVAGMSETLAGQFGEGVRKKKVDASTEVRIAPPKSFGSLTKKDEASGEKD